MKYFIPIALLIISCTGVQVTTINITKPVHLRPAMVKCDNSQPFEVKYNNSKFYTIFSGGEFKKTKPGFLDREILAKDATDKYWLQIDEVEFGSYGTSLLLFGSYNSWINTKFSQCNSDQEKGKKSDEVN